MFGVLNDLQIKEFVEAGKLVVENYNVNNLKQACYELRAGNTYFDLNNNGKRYEIEDDEIIPFKPHQRVAIITKEKLDIPNNILARIITKGSLFSLGISPVCTYADPGFCGNLGIVLQNCSNNYIKIKCNEAIAKIEFEQLEQEVSKPYSGQHGFETNIWPIRSDKIMNEQEIASAFPKRNDITEIEQAFGEPIANICERIIERENIIIKKEILWIVVTIVFVIVNMILIALAINTKWYGPMWSIITGIIANIVFLFLQLIIKKRGKVK